MASFVVAAAQRTHPVIVARGALEQVAEYLPVAAGQVFVATTHDVWKLYGARVSAALQRPVQVLFWPGGEAQKRLAHVEMLAEQMVERGADRSSVIVAVGGGIVTDMSGFLAAIFMRGIPVIQVPTTLLAQVDAAVGGKTGVNLIAGKNLIGSFHQPLAVLIDPDVLGTLPEREYRAGLYEIIKCGVIRSAALFELLEGRREAVLAQQPEVVDEIIAESVGIKAEVVSADEKESDLRRILNFGHTVGHAIEAETKYERLLHGEAVAVGMRAATHLARELGYLSADDAGRINGLIARYGPVPAVTDLSPEALLARLQSDKKTVQGTVHFVLPTRIGATKIVSGIDRAVVRDAIALALHE